MVLPELGSCSINGEQGQIERELEIEMSRVNRNAQGILEETKVKRTKMMIKQDPVHFHLALLATGVNFYYGYKVKA